MRFSSKIGAENAFATLRRLAQPQAAGEQCEFCNASLAGEHRHLAEPATRKIICVCDPCALRFENVQGRWSLIPREIRHLPDLPFTDADWESLALPIQLAFLFRNSAANRTVAMYPSPAGATETMLDEAKWADLVAANPLLGRLRADVEALLVNRLAKTPECYLAPIDVCYELVGLIRLHWKGLSGGERVWQEIQGFFSSLKERAQSSPALPALAHA